MTRTDKASGVGLYLALTFGLSCIFYALIIATGHVGGGMGYYVTGLMWCPATAAVLTCLLRRESLQRLGWRWGAWRWQWLAYAVPLAYAAIGYAIVWTTGLGGFGNADFIAKLTVAFGWNGAPTGVVVSGYFLLLATVGIVRSLSTALGEEIGWRGFLTPALVARFGFTGGALVTGVIWAAWHMPILLFADYNAGTSWWFAMPCFVVLVLSCSVIMTWLRMRSGSLWTGALVHASHNLFIQAFFTPITIAHGTITPYAIDEFGFVVPLVMTVFAVVFWLRRDRAMAAASAA